ncbi:MULTISPECIES: RHS repeat domain-containing protein [unclassified Fibrobacter]|uniref:RHS repeat domain-containing protein n=1 Tax=unclassified Fibrobacter TaxID=2634177 RepID=UPI00091AC92A|nr:MULTISPECIES: RHS repeat-associated core domain-containing protein [unclassified Fibrobacter]OWV01607.1 hypothetical protein B7993_15420 [Fibrobacter sp. UWH3]SHL87423.1 RHS repeat-associated core domain-containing protein [Fibrobacter sp. UWH6]
MKKILILLFLIVGFSFADVIAQRYSDGKIHRALPSWIDMSDAEIMTFSVNGTVLSLPDANQFTYMSRTYSNLTIFADGRISFGNLTNGLDRDIEPYLQPVSVEVDMGSSFKWKSFVDANSNYLTIVEMGPFLYRGKYYSVQSTFFIDGEIQVQLWQNDVAHAKPELLNWMLPILYNGTVKTRPEKKQVTRMDIYGPNGLRPGWIAKSFNGAGVSITEPNGTGDGLLVNMGTSSQAGGLLAYDYSREYPVVGGIRNIEVKMLDPVDVDDSLCIWFFDEFQGTVYAGYPSMKMNQIMKVFTPDDYTNQWGGPFYTSPYVTRSAPAFKFQLAYPQNQNMAFRIGRIVYNLKQLPSIQFLPPKPYQLTFSITGSGRVSMNTPSGTSPFNLYNGEKVSASITSKAGSSIERITVNGKIIVLNGEIISKMPSMNQSFNAARDSNEYVKLFKAYGDRPYSKIDFDITAMHENVNVIIKFAPCEARTLDVVPEMVKTDTYLDPINQPNARKFTSAVFKDAFGTTVQTQDSLSNGKYIVSAVYSDALGKTKYEPMSFVLDTTTFVYMDMACEACVVAANNYYDGTDSTDKPNAESNAFTEFEPRYGNESGSFGRNAGIARRSFEFQQQVQEAYGLPASVETDFLHLNYLNEGDISDNFRKRIKNPGGKHLTISRDAEGRYTQSVTDEKNRTVSTWTYDGENELVVMNEYDGYDRLIRSYLRDFPAFADTMDYDAMGRLLSKKSNDRGLVEYAYDSLGNLRFTRNARQKALGNNYFMANVYDGEGRVVAIGEVHGGHDFAAPNTAIASAALTPIVRTVYGKPTSDTLTLYGVNLNSSLLGNILSQMDGIRDYDVGAIIAYNGEGNPVSIKMKSYDRIGRMSRQWVVYLFDDVPAVQLSYVYNLSDELASSTYSEWAGSGWTQKSTRTRTYDNKGRLVETREGNSMLASYTYSANGNVVSKHYYDAGTEVFAKTVRRDVYGRPVVLDYRNGSTELYSENISYENPLSVRQSTVARVWADAGTVGRVVENAGYTYDYLGRLTEMSGTRNASYSYDELGRLTVKHEGSQAVGYYYGSQNHQGYYRPYGMTISGRSYTPFEYYSYDAAGNVWLDRYASSAYELDTRALPECVRLYPEVPAGITQDNLENYASSELGRIYMAYDENGQRVYFNYNSGSSNYGDATLSGVGVYHRDGLGMPYSLVRQDLIAGGYRKDGSAYFPVTDAQGNIRGYANTSGVQSAYAYYPYGTLIDLAHDNAEDSRRWQSKEFDSDINKYYFGARFYDPLFGLWLTPDPAGQFANPYTYGGDPINYIDPNGESLTAAIAIGAAVGAAIGASVSAVNCSGASEVSCGRAVAQGTLKGAAVGAISGAISGGVAAVASGISGTASVAAEGGAMIASAGAETANAASYSYAIFNNMFWSTVESSLQYAATGWMNDGGYSWSGFGGAALGGLLGGAIPGYQPVLGEGIVKNVLAETAYSGVRSAALGYLGGGLGSLMRNGAWNNDAAVQGALLGGISGSVGALVKIGAFGYAVPKSDKLKKEAEYADKHNLIIGPYGSVRRSGGAWGWIQKNVLRSSGITLGRNLLVMGEENVSVHEGIHYMQQVRDGTLQFYARTVYDYMTIGNKESYSTEGTYEYEAEKYGKTSY